MCSIVMPADYEMLVSHSPPVFSHGASYLSNYPSFRSDHDAFRTVPRGFCRPPQQQPSQPRVAAKMPASPRRPCLVIRPDDSSSDEDPPSPTRLKKKVVFADDHGRPLTQVRIMTEPSNMPPLWSCKFLAEVTRGISAEPIATDEPWEVAFQQPASSYIEFRKKLEHGKVSLENVIVKEQEEIVLGTIKVSNLAFHKEVFVRSTTNEWKTSEDVYCKFVPNSSTNTVSAAYVLYDTFSFKLTLPPKSKRIEFCVCFKCENREFWDNNGGSNYVIIKKVQFHKSASSDELLNLKNIKVDKLKKNPSSFDIIQAIDKIEPWSEFACWNHLDTSNPYW